VLRRLIRLFKPFREPIDEQHKDTQICRPTPKKMKPLVALHSFELEPNVGAEIQTYKAKECVNAERVQLIRDEHRAQSIMFVGRNCRTAQKQILESAREVPLGGNIKYSVSRGHKGNDKMASGRVADVTKEIWMWRSWTNTLLERERITEFNAA